jgi:cholesterol transport system auxiliary component
LRVTLDVFDQVFDSPQTSRGVVQLRAELADGNGQHSVIASTLVKVEKASAGADAKGGVAALTAATDDAITELKGWVETQKCGETEN